MLTVNTVEFLLHYCRQWLVTNLRYTSPQLCRLSLSSLSKPLRSPCEVNCSFRVFTARFIPAPSFYSWAEKQRISTKSNCCNFELLRMRTRHEIVHWFATACLSHIHRTHCAHSKQLDSCLWKCHWERQDWQRVRWRRIQGDRWSYVERFNSWSVG